MSKINLRIISKPHAHLQSMMKTSVKFQNNRNKTVGGVAHTRYPLSIHFHYQNARKMTKFKLQKKVSKINLRIISKPHAHLQSMMKTSVKFQNNRNKTVGGVAHTRYPLSIHFHYQNARKMTKFKLQKKVSKINLRIISKPHAHLQSMMKTSVKFQKNWNKTVGGVAHTRYPLSIHFHYQNARKMTKFKLRKKCQKLF